MLGISCMLLSYFFFFQFTDYLHKYGYSDSKPTEFYGSYLCHLVDGVNIVPSSNTFQNLVFFQLVHRC